MSRRSAKPIVPFLLVVTIAVTALSAGCGGRIGKIGFIASDDGTSVTYTSPALERLGCNVKWIEKVRGFIGAACASDDEGGDE